MSIYTSIAGGTGKILAVTVRNMLSRFGVSEPLGQAEVYYINVMLLLANSDEEVVRFDVSV